MKIIENKVKNFFLISGIFCLSWVILISIFFPKMNGLLSNIRAINEPYFISLLNIVCLIISIVILLTLLKIPKKEKINKVYLILGCELFIYFVYLILITKYYGINAPIDDAWVVFNNAKSVINTGKIEGWYMISNPQNNFLMFFYLLINKLFSNMDYNILIGVFSFVHVLTALLVYKSAALISKNETTSFIVLQLFIFCYQISLHITNVYTDTLSIFIVSIGLYLLLKSEVIENKRKSIVLFILASTFFSIGYLSKGTVLILLIAFCIYLVVYKSGTKKMLVFIPIVSFLCTSLIWNYFINETNIYNTDKVGMPNTHYIYMGLDAGNPEGSTLKERMYILNGAYNETDLNTSKNLFFDQNLSKKEVTKKHISLIKERLNKFDLKSGFEFLNAKIGTSWSSGDLKSTFSIKISATNEEKELELLNSYSKYMYMQTLQFLYYLIAMYAFVKGIRKNDSLTLLSAIFTIGMFSFLILWEAAPRYIISLLPFYMLLFANITTHKKKSES